MSDPLAVMSDRPLCRSLGISWCRLRPGDTTGVKRARQFVAEIISPYVSDPDHVHTVQWLASEALANAIVAADDYAARRCFEWTYLDSPVHLGVVVTARWGRLDIRDPDPVMPEPKPHDLEDEHGRGRPTLDLMAARVWHTSTAYDKVVHVLIAAPGVELTVDELERAAR